MKQNKLSFILLIIYSLLLTANGHSIKLAYKEDKSIYTTQINIGKNNQEFTIQIDITTSETYIPSKTNTFESLDVQKYDYKTSSSAQLTNKRFDIEDRYGIAKGIAVYDTVVIGPFFMENYGLIQVEEFSLDFKGSFNGKLGLGYKAPKIYKKKSNNENFNFLKYLKGNGLINHEIFTILPSSQEILIGNFPFFYNNTDYTYCNLSVINNNKIDKQFENGWLCDLSNVFYGVDTEKKSLEYSEVLDSQALFDISSEYIEIPYSHFENFKSNFIKKLFENTCQEVKRNYEVYFICENEYHIPHSSIAFFFGSNGYIVKGENLFRPIDENKYEMLIRFNKESLKYKTDVFILGAPFFKQYNLTFDAENKNIRFYGGEFINIETERDSYMFKQSNSDIQNLMKSLLIFVAIIGGLLFFIVLLLVIRSCRKNNLEMSDGENKNNKELSLTKNEQNLEKDDINY